MGAVVFQFSASLKTFGPCYKCGIEFAAPEHFVNARLADGQSFFCPNGHSQHYTETEVQRLTKQLEAEKKRVEQEKLWREQADKKVEEARAETRTARKAEAIVRGKLKAQSERVKNGVCPCCNRTFQNLQRHMQTRHPDFTSEQPSGQ